MSGGGTHSVPPQSGPRPYRVAVLDLNRGIANEGMRSIRSLLSTASSADGRGLDIDVFEVRLEGAVPGLDYDAYISSGGPGSPFAGEGAEWERRYFEWMRGLWDLRTESPEEAGSALFICHSFQLMCRAFGLAKITRRRKPAFGIYEVAVTGAGMQDPLLHGLHSRIHAADFRKWQAVRPDRNRIREFGGRILALEKERPHVDLERAVMGIRLGVDLPHAGSGEGQAQTGVSHVEAAPHDERPGFVGVQFHPEADPVGMRRHFNRPDKRDAVIEEYGEARFERLLDALDDPDFLIRTYRAVIPRFIERSLPGVRLDPDLAMRLAAGDASGEASHAETPG